MARVQTQFSGRLTIIPCPQCNGAVYESGGGEQGLFVCEKGHQFTIEQLPPNVKENLHRAWDAVLKTLEA